MSNYNRYGFKITPNSRELSGIGVPAMAGIIKNDTLVFPFSQSLKTGENGGVIGWAEKALGDSFKSVMKAVSGEENLASQTEVYTIKAPKEFESPRIEFEAVLYEGLEVKGVTTPSYAQWMRNVANIMLPKRKTLGVGAILTSNQTDMEDYMAMLTTGSKIGDFSTAKIGFGIQLGNFFSCPNGWWVTSINATTPLVLDKGGSPVVWEASFSLEYYKQIRCDEFSKWMDEAKS